jgi:hypothetical protein
MFPTVPGQTLKLSQEQASYLRYWMDYPVPRSDCWNLEHILVRSLSTEYYIQGAYSL